MCLRSTMTRKEENRTNEAAKLWRLICTSLVGILEQAGTVPVMPTESLAEECIRALTGSRTRMLETRWENLQDNAGIHGANKFKAMRNIRLQKAVRLLRSVYDYIEDNSSRTMSMTRAQCLIPGILRYFMEGAERIKRYEAADRQLFYFPGIGVRVYITDGDQVVEAEVVPDSFVGVNVSSGQALLVITGRGQGMFATLGKLGKLYRRIFPNDDRTFVISDRYFWTLGPALPSMYSGTAEQVAQNSYDVTDVTRTFKKVSHPDWNPKDYPGAKPLQFIHKRETPSWKIQNSYEKTVNKLYAQDTCVQQSDPVHPEPTSVEEDLPEVGMLTLNGFLPLDMAAFHAEYGGCQRFMSENWEDIQELTRLNKKLAKAEEDLIAVKKEITSAKLSDENLEKLYRIRSRWEDFYGCIPTITDDMDQRGSIVDEIDNILRPLAGDNAVIFKAMEKDNGEEK